MCAVLASAQVVLSEDIAREAANAEEVEGKEDGSPDKAPLELDWKGSQLDVKRKRASEGPSKQNLRVSRVDMSGVANHPKLIPISSCRISTISFRE